MKKLDLTCRMVAWVIELLEYDITYTLMNNIKSHVLAYFLIKLSLPTPEEGPEKWTLSVDGSFNL